MNQEIDHYQIQLADNINDELLSILEKTKPLTLTIINREEKIGSNEILDFLKENYHYNFKLNLYTYKHYFKENCGIEEIGHGNGIHDYVYRTFNCDGMYEGRTLINYNDVEAYRPIIVYSTEGIWFELSDNYVASLRIHGRNSHYNGRNIHYNMLIIKNKPLLTKKAVDSNNNNNVNK